MNSPASFVFEILAIPSSETDRRNLEDEGEYCKTAKFVFLNINKFRE